MNTNIFRSMSYGVYVVSVMDKGRPTGCIANSIMQVTSTPATVAVSISHENYTNSCIDTAGVFAYSILSEESDPGIIGTFGFQSGKNVNKFDSIAYEVAEGVPVVKDSCGYVVCNVIDKMETATHTVFIGEVTEGKVYEGAPDVMTYAYYHKVVKGKSPKNAPTYLPDTEVTEDRDGKESSAAHRWVCRICGYVHEGEVLPGDFICPVCRQGADKFKLVAE